MAKPVTIKPGSKGTVFYLIILVLVTFAVYANSLGNDFVFDDESVIQGDPSITSLSNIPDFFTGEKGFHKVIGAYFRPVVSASYTIDYSLWGLKPFGFHLSNVLIHIASVFLFFALMRNIFRTSRSEFKEYAVLTGALLFAVHPVHTEAVSWVSGRTDALACVFYLAAFLYYLKYSGKPSGLNAAAVMVLYSLALLSKEMAVTFPAAVIIYDLVINKIKPGEILKKKIFIYLSLLVISAIYLLFRQYVLSGAAPRQTYNYFYSLDLQTAVYTMLQTIPVYLKLVIFPVNLLYHYSGYLPDVSTPLEILPAVSVLVIIILASAVIYFYKKLPMISFGIIFFFTALLPVLNIIPTMNFMAERYLYIPSVSFSLIAAALLLKYYSVSNANLMLGFSFSVLLLFGYLTADRNTDWKTNDTLYLSADGRPGTVTYVNLGNIYARRGDLGVAEVYYRKALDLRYETPVAHNNMGKIFMANGNFDSAYYYINTAYKLDTLSPEPVYTMAELYGKNGKIPEAINWLEKLMKISTSYLNSVQILKELKMQQLSGKSGDTLSVKKNAAASDSLKNIPDVKQLEESSLTNYQTKKYDIAVKELNMLLKLNPAGASGYYSNIGMCYLDEGKYGKAIEYFNLSVKSDPGFSTGYNNLGDSYKKLGDLKQAESWYRKAIEADPNNALAKQNLETLK